jgi:hypothetical protein
MSTKMAFVTGKIGRLDIQLSAMSTTMAFVTGKIAKHQLALAEGH